MIVSARREEILGAAAEAAAWRAVSLLFSCPGPGWRKAIEPLAPEVRDETLRRAVLMALDQAAEGFHMRLFRPVGPVPIREAALHRGVELGNFLASIVAFYAAFGYEPSADEPPDHFSVETDFLAFLKLKYAFALANEDTEAAEATHRAWHTFASSHVAVMAAALRQALDREETGYLGQAARAAAALAPAPSVTTLPVLHVEEEESNCFPCGDPG
jgi:TorA maturation chaperone TorD